MLKTKRLEDYLMSYNVKEVNNNISYSYRNKDKNLRKSNKSTGEQFQNHLDMAKAKRISNGTIIFNGTQLR